MKSDSIDAVLLRAPLPAWQKVFNSLDNFLAAKPWTVLKNHHFIGLNSGVEMLWLQVLGSGGEAPGLNIHRGSAGLAALLRILSGSAETDQEAQVLMRGLDCLSLSWEDKAQLDASDQAILEAAGLRGKGRFPQVRDCQPGWYPWHPDAIQLEQAALAIEILVASLPTIRLQPELLEPDDDSLAGVIFQETSGDWKSELRPMPDFDILDRPPPQATTLDGRTLTRVEELVIRLPKGVHRLELGCIVLSNASDPGDGGRPFFPQVMACVEAKSHALLAHKVLSPAELTAAAWRDCLIEGMEALGQRPSHIDSDGVLAGAAVHSISDLLGCIHHPDSRLKALETVERAIDRLL